MTVQRGASPARSALLVGLGIVLSRLAGLVRERAFAHYFGHSAAADAFRAAFRIPNLLQNLFGEGALSASFIPVYARLLAQGDAAEADRVAGAVLALLALVTSVLVLAGIAAAPYLIDVVVPGFTGDTRDLTVQLVRVLFPGAGLLVGAAWCLGILNSHGRFFLSYTAPVLWNAAMIATLLGLGGRRQPYALAEALAWGSVAGSALQLGAQWPSVRRVARELRLSLDVASAHVRRVWRNFVPVFVGRGVVQLSAYIDTVLASWLPTGALAALSYAQTLALLPISLFGLSVSAAELPAMASVRGPEPEIAGALGQRLDAGLRRIAFCIAPSAMALLALGDVIAAAVYQSGRFTAADARYVWSIAAGLAAGLWPTTLGRLYASAHYAQGDTRTPLRCAIVRIALATAVGYLCAIVLPPALGMAARWGVVGLAGASSLAGWLEFALLRRALNRRLGRTGVPLGLAGRLWGAALASAAVAWGVKLALGHQHPLLVAMGVLGAYGCAYGVLTLWWRVSEAKAIVGRLVQVVGRAR
jgi:putative peptidoglycan lipid II flippase